MDKLESIVKKAKNLNLEAYKEGKYNFEHPTPEIEKIARERAKTCAGCDLNQPEPITKYKVLDKIAEISERSCRACGCISPYLVRQNVKTCKLKKWT